MSPTAVLIVGLALPLVGVTTTESSGSGDNAGEDSEFGLFGLELWSVVVSACALALSLITIAISCLCCWCCSGLRCFRRGKQPRHVADPGIWGVQSGTDTETDTHFSGNESAATNNFSPHSNFTTLPEITVHDAVQPREDCEDQGEEDLYDDGSTVRGTRPESNLYAEAETVKSDSEPLYNNIPGDNVSQGSYYMQLIAKTVDESETYDKPSPARRRPKDNTEIWEPPHL